MTALRLLRSDDRGALTGARGPIHPLDIPDSGPTDLLIDRLHPRRHTLLYGPGGSGKSTLAAHWSIRLVRDGERVVIIDYEGNDDEWRSRLIGLGLNREDPIRYVAPNDPGYCPDPSDLGSLLVGAPRIKRWCDEFDATYLVVDSVGFATGQAELISDRTAVAYGAALNAIGRPSLSIHHTPSSDDTRPFGSSFFQNVPRLTWNVRPTKTGARLTCRKSNDGYRGRAFDVSFNYSGGQLAGVTEQRANLSTPDLITELLSQSPMTIDEIRRLIGGLPSTVDKALQRGKQAGRFVKRADGTWANGGALAQTDKR